MALIQTHWDVGSSICNTGHSIQSTAWISHRFLLSEHQYTSCSTTAILNIQPRKSKTLDQMLCYAVLWLFRNKPCFNMVTISLGDTGVRAPSQTPSSFSLTSPSFRCTTWTKHILSFKQSLFALDWYEKLRHENWCGNTMRIWNLN